MASLSWISTAQSGVRLATLGVLCSLGLLGSCASMSVPEAATEAPAAMDQAEKAIPAANVPNGDAAAEAEATGAANVPASAPQLVKRASLRVVVDDVDSGINAVYQAVQQARGDVLSLQDFQPQRGEPRQVALTLRVPQDTLETTLQVLRDLGTVEQQSITAEDVSSQLVDMEARLRNLRKSEEALQKIMERSGEIQDVLNVARELSNVRESIERIAAQQKALQQQVAYSSIDLTLEGAIAAVPAQRPLGETLGSTWQAATQSMGDLSVGLLKLLLWLIAYSPYIAVILLIGFGMLRLRRRRSAGSAEPTEG